MTLPPAVDCAPRAASSEKVCVLTFNVDDRMVGDVAVIVDPLPVPATDTT